MGQERNGVSGIRRNSAVRGLQTEDSVEGGRNANRASAVGTQRKRSESSRDRRTCSSGRTARSLAQIPRITSYATERAVRDCLETEFRSRGLSNQYRTCCNELRHGGSIFVGHMVLSDAGAERGANTPSEEQIFDRNWQSVQRT